MGHIHGFGVKNFRVFKKETVFKFAPITVLTGTNNSGKSSIIKALLLLQENLHSGKLSEELNNTKGSNLGLFNSFLNEKRKKDLSFYISVPFGKVIKGIGSDWMVELKFSRSEDTDKNSGTLGSIQFFDKISGVSLFSIKLLRQKVKTPESDSFNAGYPLLTAIIALNTSLILDEIKKSKLSSLHGLINYDLLPKGFSKSLEDIGRSFEIPKNFQKSFDDMIKTECLRKEKLSLNRISRNKFRFLKWNSDLRFLLHYSFENPDEEIQKKVENIESEALRNISQGKCSFENEIEFIKSLSLNDPLKLFSLNNLGKEDAFIPNLLRTFSVYTIDYKNLTEGRIFLFEILVYEVLYLLYKHGLLKDVIIDFDKYENLHKKAVNNVDNVWLYGNSGFRVGDDRRKWLSNENLSSLEEFFKNIVKVVTTYTYESLNFIFIPATRTSFERVSSNIASKTVFNEILQEFSTKTHLLDFHIEFVNYWLKKFEIGEKMIVENIEGVLKAVYIVKGTRKINIVDLGSGSNQILPILLKIISTSENQELLEGSDGKRITDSSPKTFIIEEPESNLHPKLQSIFADFIIDAAYKFNLQVIIETHSEYLIRKLQYWTARKVIRPEDTIIHYLTDPQRLIGGEEEQQIRTIRILEDGSLSGDFGPGFFDEATNWQWELMRLKNSQKN